MQILDDPELLKLMMADLERAPELLRPAEFWERHESGTLKWLNKFGLSEFRRQRAHNISFGGGPQPTSLRLFGSYEAIRLRYRWAAKLIRTIDLLIDDLEATQQTLGNIIFSLVYAMPRGGRIWEIDDSLIGAPKDVIQVRGKKYSIGFLQYCYHMLMLDHHFELEKKESILEIGCGYGGLEEVLLKAFPHLKIAAMDIPPQLYVAEQFLSAVFPGRVVGYRETSKMGKIDILSRPDGSVFILAPWQLERLYSGRLDLTVNKASFQEMSLNQVEFFARHIDRTCKVGVYIANQREGCGGVRNPVTRENYKELFAAFCEYKEFPDGLGHLGGYLDGDPARPYAHGDIYIFSR